MLLLLVLELVLLQVLTPLSLLGACLWCVCIRERYLCGHPHALCCQRR